jgi:hypothetical protein
MIGKRAAIIEKRISAIGIKKAVGGEQIDYSRRGF